MPEIPEPPERLADAVVALRAIAEWDIPEILIAHQDDPQLHAKLGQARPPTGAQLGRQVEEAQAHRLAGSSFSLTLVEPGGSDCRGRIDVSAIDWDQRRAELSVWVAPQFRGRGYGDHALALATAWLTGAVGLSDLAVSVVVDEPHGT